MTSTPRKVLTLLLCLLLAAPANAGLVGWMALSMTDRSAAATEHDAAEVHHPGHGKAHVHGEAHDSQSMPHTSHSHKDHGISLAVDHESHDEADCNEHCVSCANHCLNLGILSDSVMSSRLHSPLQGLESGNLRSYPDLLYRPPICS